MAKTINNQNSNSIENQYTKNDCATQTQQKGWVIAGVWEMFTNPASHLLATTSI